MRNGNPDPMADAAYNSSGLTGLLGILFIALKLCKVIDWSWWWVLSPFWIPVALVLLIVGGAFLGVWLAKLLGYIE